LADELKLTQNNTTLRDFSQHEQFICQNGRGDLYCSLCSEQAHLVADNRVTNSAWIKGSAIFSNSPISGSSSSSSNNADYVQLPIKPVLAEPA
jgi:hypothetical protein